MYKFQQCQKQSFIKKDSTISNFFLKFKNKFIS